MGRMFQTIYEGGSAEIIEKKSRFIAHTAPAASEEEAAAYIQQMKKKYWDAAHNCSAYVIGEQNEIERCHDDGEPQRTAGKPILDVILGKELRNVVVVVTRYFGGTLLGTGGLIRAYSKAAKEGIEASRLISKKYGKKLGVLLDYTEHGKLQYWFTREQITVLETVYTDKVYVEVLIPDGAESFVEQSLTEETNGKVQLDWGESCKYMELDGQIEVL